MADLLPVGAYVRVTQRIPNAAPFVQSDLAAVGGDGGDRQRAFVGRVVGYDTWRTKYSVGRRFAGWGGWRFADRGSWAFPGEVEEISEEEALRVEAAS